MVACLLALSMAKTWQKDSYRLFKPYTVQDHPEYSITLYTKDKTLGTSFSVSGLHGSKVRDVKSVVNHNSNTNDYYNDRKLNKEVKYAAVSVSVTRTGSSAADNVDATNKYVCIACMVLEGKAIASGDKGFGACFDNELATPADASNSDKQYNKFRDHGFGTLVMSSATKIKSESAKNNGWLENGHTTPSGDGSGEFSYADETSFTANSLTLVSGNLYDGAKIGKLGISKKADAKLQCFASPGLSTAPKLSSGVTIDDTWIKSTILNVDLSHWASAMTTSAMMAVTTLTAVVSLF